MGSDGYISASGATVQQRDLDVIANNLANAGTPGYKRSQSIFRAALEARLRDEAGRLQPGAPGRAFVSTDAVGTDFGRGAAQHTGSPLHAMIDGPGFFEIQTDRGLRYSRAGNFIVNREGLLAAPDGAPVMGQGGPIAIPDGTAEIDANGGVTDSRGNVLGRLRIVDFESLQTLEREGNSLFRPTEQSVAIDVERPAFVPGSVEASNVESARELATLMMLQRAFETNLRAMQTDDQTTERLIEGMR
ncbi:MAG: flagellar hook basal-body protein [Myxococcota bacterium]|nr:flagellar hook basal-body protein [Myxococcales bacterium]